MSTKEISLLPIFYDPQVDYLGVIPPSNGEQEKTYIVDVPNNYFLSDPDVEGSTVKYYKESKLPMVAASLIDPLDRPRGAPVPEERAFRF